MAARRIQAAWRGSEGRREAANARFLRTQEAEDLKEVGNEAAKLG
jgi:hypothetical protein